MFLSSVGIHYCEKILCYIFWPKAFNDYKLITSFANEVYQVLQDPKYASASRKYFRKLGHVCNISKKGMF